MRQVISLNSVKGIYLNDQEIIQHLKEISKNALQNFPEIVEIRLIGSLANHTATGLSDVDLWIIVEEYKEQNPIERLKPYYFYFLDNITLSLDIIICLKDDMYKNIYKNFLLKSIVLSKR